MSARYPSWDGFGSPADGGLIHEADLFNEFTLCGARKSDGAWTSVTTRTTCPMCAVESVHAAARYDADERARARPVWPGVDDIYCGNCDCQQGCDL